MEELGTVPNRSDQPLAWWGVISYQRWSIGGRADMVRKARTTEELAQRRVVESSRKTRQETTEAAIVGKNFITHGDIGRARSRPCTSRGHTGIAVADAIVTRDRSSMDGGQRGHRKGIERSGTRQWPIFRIDGGIVRLGEDVSRRGLQERLPSPLHVPGGGLELLVHGSSIVVGSTSVGSAAKHAQMGRIRRWQGYMKVVIVR